MDGSENSSVFYSWPFGLHRSAPRAIRRPAARFFSQHADPLNTCQNASSASIYEAHPAPSREAMRRFLHMKPGRARKNITIELCAGAFARALSIAFLRRQGACLMVENKLTKIDVDFWGLSRWAPLGAFPSDRVLDLRKTPLKLCLKKLFGT